MTIKLYSAAGSIGFAAHITLEELKSGGSIDYELVLLDMQSSEQKSDQYQRINPKARVPSLVVDGTVLTETPAILVYLAQLAPDSPVALPADPMEFAQIQSFNSYLCSTVHVAHAHKFRGARWVQDKAALAALTAHVPTTMTECCRSIEAHFLAGPWVFGDAYSICDPYLFTIASWLESDGVDVEQFPKLKRHRENMKKRDAVSAALQQLEAR